MQCERAQDLVSACVDRELPAAYRGAWEPHGAQCQACAALAGGFRSTGRTLARRGREPLPSGLEAKVRASLARVPEGSRELSLPERAVPMAGRAGAAWQRHARQAA